MCGGDAMGLLFVTYVVFAVGIIALLNADPSYQAGNSVKLSLFVIGVAIRFALFLTLLFMLQLGITALYVGL
jgi:hypothetical protein